MRPHTGAPAPCPPPPTSRLTSLFVALSGLIALLLPWPAATAAGPAGAGAPAGASGGAAPGRDGRVWPVEYEAGAGRPTVLRGWEPPPAPWAAGHRGVDLAARTGRPVRAVAAGRVSFAGPVAGRGVLAIELPGTGRPPLRTTYEPVRAVVAEGERVRAGQVVGVLGAGPFHCPSGCLHWGLRGGDRYLDPLSLLDPSMRGHGPSRLLPVFGVLEGAGAREGPGPRERAGVTAAPRTAGDRAPLTRTAGAAGPFHRSPGPGELAPSAALAAAAAWAGARLRRAAPGAGRVVSVRGTPRAGPWRRRPP
ncbi:M23 family metallopeptidase [Streptomyces sp. NPDC005970]|uniref:murein hydrolase activator EnvC family protein n=1 Tax=Streptomyces sp. NPDC005970 TaxID=3156723 RepID=UPI0033C58C9A